MPTTHRIVPMSGHDLARRSSEEHATGFAAMAPAEVHSSTDALGFMRFFVGHKHVGGYLWHGPVATEAAMLALDNPGIAHACYPGDTCLRTDTGAIMLCIENHGALASDWVVIGYPDLAAAVASKADASDLVAVVEDVATLATRQLTDSGAGISLIADTPFTIRKLRALRGITLTADATGVAIGATGGAGGGISWRVVSGATDLAADDYVVATGSAVQSFTADALASDGTDAAVVHVIGSGGVQVTLGGALIYESTGITALVIRRTGDALRVSATALDRYNSSYLRSLRSSSLLADVDGMLISAADGATLASLPVTVGAAVAIPRGTITATTVGGRRGMYLASGAGSAAFATVTAEFTLVFAGRSEKTTGRGRIIQGVTNNWFLGVEAGNWTLYNGGFNLVRAVTTGLDLMVLLYTQSPSGARLTWRAADGTVATRTLSSSTTPGALCAGYGAYNEPIDGTLFEAGAWGQWVSEAEAAVIVAGLAARWALS